MEARSQDIIKRARLRDDCRREVASYLSDLVEDLASMFPGLSKSEIVYATNAALMDKALENLIGEFHEQNEGVCPHPHEIMIMLGQQLGERFSVVHDYMHTPLEDYDS
jgi:predicted solute-binding protein